MIIDSHMHFEHERSFFNLPNDSILKFMNRYAIDMGILSADIIEFGHGQEPLPKETRPDQFEVNRKLLDFAKESNGRLKASYWCTPADSENENMDRVHHFILENRDTFIGLKFHPYHSKLALTDKLYDPFYELAGELELPVLIHCSPDAYGNPGLFACAAERFPRTQFILAHMNIGTENDEAIEAISKYDNLYGDTSWVKYENFKKAIKRCSSKKILFGTDAPIDGERTYHFYKDILSDFTNLKSAELEDVMVLNAKTLYHL